MYSILQKGEVAGQRKDDFQPSLLTTANGMVKAGFVGDAAPRSVFPSIAKVSYVGDEARASAAG